MTLPASGLRGTFSSFKSTGTLFLVGPWVPSPRLPVTGQEARAVIPSGPPCCTAKDVRSQVRTYPSPLIHTLGNESTERESELSQDRGTDSEKLHKETKSAFIHHAQSELSLGPSYHLPSALAVPPVLFHIVPTLNIFTCKLSRWGLIPSYKDLSLSLSNIFSVTSKTDVRF